MTQKGEETVEDDIWEALRQIKNEKSKRQPRLPAINKQRKELASLRRAVRLTAGKLKIDYSNKMERTLRAIGYARVSTQGQADEGTIQIQIDAINRFCTKEGHDLVHPVFMDEGVSGTTELENRPGLGELLNYLEAEKIDAVIIYKLDRLARRMWAQEFLLNKFKAHSVSILSVTEPVLNGEDDKERVLLRQILGALAEYEKEIIKLRLFAGRIKKAEQGKHASGPLPFGFSTTEDGTFVFNEAETTVVRRIFDLRMKEAKSYREIAQTILKEFDQKFTFVGIKYILRNPIYKGELRYAHVRTQVKMGEEAK